MSVWIKFGLTAAALDLVGLVYTPPGDVPISPIITIGTQVPVIVGGVGAIGTGSAGGIVLGGGAIAIGIGGLTVGGYHFGKWITTTGPGKRSTEWAGGSLAANGIN